jgi:hypothetical protein
VGRGHEGHHDMTQHCLDMMNAMMGGGASGTSNMSPMGLNLPLSLVAVLILVGALDYLLGMRRARTQA